MKTRRREERNETEVSEGRENGVRDTGKGEERKKGDKSEEVKEKRMD